MARRMFAHGADAVDEMLRAAVAQVVAVDAGDHDVLELQRGDGLRQVDAARSASGGCGRPCATSQNGQRRVHRSPRIMKVAVPLPKHSPMLGQDASSHTVCRLCSRRACLISLKRRLLAARTRIQSGFFSRSCGHDLDRDARGLRRALLLVVRRRSSGTPGQSRKRGSSLGQTTAGGVHR